MSLKKNKHISIPIFVPEAACPHQCVFCNQKKISGQADFPTIDFIHDTIEKYLTTVQKNSRVEIAFFGGNFTGIDMENQEKLLKTVQPYLVKNRVHAIRISTRPDYINPNILKLLKFYGVKNIELGAQSLDEEVLQLSGRGHLVQDIEKASKIILASGFHLGLQMMIGLPGDSRDKSIQTAKKIIELGANETRVYPALVIPETKMSKMYLEKKYSPLSISEAINWLADLIPLFNDAGVKILRVGLHPSEGFSSGNDLLAGPFHVNLKEMALTEIWRRKFRSILLKQGETCEVHVPPNQINHAIGFQKRNKVILLEKFHKVHFIPDADLNNWNFYADCS